MAAVKRRIIEVKSHFDSGYILLHYPLGIMASVGAGVAGLKAYGVLLPVRVVVIALFILLVLCMVFGYVWNNGGWLEEQIEFSNRRNPTLKRILRLRRSKVTFYTRGGVKRG